MAPYISLQSELVVKRVVMSMFDANWQAILYDDAKSPSVSSKQSTSSKCCSQVQAYGYAANRAARRWTE